MEKNREKVESAYEAFNIFYDSMDKMFKEKEVSRAEVELMQEIYKIVEAFESKEGYLKIKQDVETLLRAENRLATLLFSLSELAANKVQRASVMTRWVRWRKVTEWSPVKTKLEEQLKEGKRLLKEDIESEVSKEIFAENVIEAMMTAHADLLLSIFDSSKSLLTSFAHLVGMRKDELNRSRVQTNFKRPQTSKAN